MATEPIVLDSITHLKPEHRGAAVLCASHGGRYAGWYAADREVGAVICNDAGVGRDRAGIAGLALLADLDVPAACVSHASARIGEGQHTLVHGRLSHVNSPAAKLGLAPGMSAREAMQKLADATLQPARRPSAEQEARLEAADLSRNGVRVFVLDSVSLVGPDDRGHVVVTASHGGLLGGRAETAVKYPVFAAVYNDADRGCGDAGISRLPALDRQGIAGACVSAFSARIGDGRSTLDDGVISTINDTARRFGGAIGQSCRQFAATMVAARAGTIATGRVILPAAGER